MSDSAAGDDADGPPREELLLDRMTDAFFGLNADWEFTYLNERGREIISDAIGEDCTVEDLEGRNIWDEIPEAHDTPFYEHYTEAMASQRPVSFVEEYAPLSTWFEVRAYPSETGLSVFFQDVTDRRRDNEELETREAVLRDVHEAIAARDDTVEEKVGALLDIGQRVLGTTYASLSRIEGDEYVFEVVRGPADSIRAGDVVPLSATNCERVVTTERSLVVENVADHPDLAQRTGHTEWGISCYLGTPVVVDGEVYGTFCFYDTEAEADAFSEWKVTLVDLMGRWVGTALAQAQTNDELRRQNERLEEFATIVSHDLRNPLSVAEGWLDVARSDDADDAEVAEALDRVEGAHGRMRSLISDVLSLARPDAVEEVEAVPLHRVATEAWANVATDGAALDADDVAAVTVDADPGRLKQLFENLFRNSVEHGRTDNRTASGDPVERDSPTARSDGDAGASTLSIRVEPTADGFAVEDDGVGLREVDSARLFDVGYSTETDGSGIGLNIVSEVAETHGWTVTPAEGETGGARFEFRT